MIVRRIRDHVAQHNWFAVAVDLAIVVAGVFLGTQANNWNEARIERARGHDYRVRLIADLRANEADLLNRRSYYGAVKRHAEAALAALDQPARPDDETLLIDAYQASQIVPRQIKRFTYNEILSAGATQSVGNPALREQIANYYVGMDTVSITFNSVPPYREHVRQAMPSVAQQNVRKRCAEKIYLTPDGTVWAKLPDACSLDLDPALVAQAAAAVRSSPAIAPDLTRQIADLDVKLSLIAPFADHARKLRALLEKAQT